MTDKTSPHELRPMPKQGWTCPRCSRVYAPTTPECRACNDAITVRKGAPWVERPGDYEAQRLVDDPQRPMCNYPGCNKPSAALEDPDRPGLRFRCEDHARPVAPDPGKG